MNNNPNPGYNRKEKQTNAIAKSTSCQPTRRDRERLAALARRLVEIHGSCANEQRLARCRAIGALNATRPIVLVDPETSWAELLPASLLQCSTPLLREWELQLLRRIFHFEQICDDTPVEDFLNVVWVMDWGDWGVPISSHQVAAQGSYAMDAPIQDLASEFGRLRHRNFSVNHAETQERLALARELVGEYLQVRPWNGTFWFGSEQAVRLMGFQPFLMAMYDAPEDLHKLMAFLAADADAMLTAMEKSGVLCACSGAVKAGSGGLGLTDDLPSDDPRVPSYRRPLRVADAWGFGDSQETVGVSPAMFQEFVLHYQAPVLRRCGLLAYGCCEPIHDRLEAIMAAFPNLRRVAVAPWTDQVRVAEMIGRKYIFSRKVNPAPLCVGFQEEPLRHDLRETLQVAGQLNLEIIMKDVHTVQGDVSRLARWVRMAREEIVRAENC